MIVRKNTISLLNLYSEKVVFLSIFTDELEAANDDVDNRAPVKAYALLFKKKKLIPAVGRTRRDHYSRLLEQYFNIGIRVFSHTRDYGLCGKISPPRNFRESLLSLTCPRALSTKREECIKNCGRNS